jgi:hypothetical protein
MLEVLDMSKELLAALVSFVASVFLSGQAVAEPAKAAVVPCGSAILLSEKYTSIESCDEAIKADRANVQAWIDRGVIHARQGLDEEAANDFDTASALLDRKG